MMHLEAQTPIIYISHVKVLGNKVLVRKTEEDQSFLDCLKITE